MQLLWPFAAPLLLLVPLLVAAYVIAQRRRRRYALRYASVSLVKEAVGRGPGVRRHIPPALFLLGLAALLIGLTRPVAVVSLPSQEGTVILALDVSGSMLADDLKPNRMEAAKAAAKSFVEKQDKNVRIGVVSFSTNASIVQAPTTDREAVIAAINRLRPQRATAVGRAILTSLDAIFEGSEDDFPASTVPGAPTSAEPTPTPLPRGVFAPATIILLTDGQNNQFPPPLSVVDQAANRGIRVYTIGVGSPEGTILRIEGRAFRTRLDEETLKRVAELTDAAYFRATTETDLRQVYEDLRTTVVLRQERSELTAAFTAIGALLSVLAGALSLFWFNRLP